MLKIKKILGILLTLCFVMSVTAATVGATPNAVNKDVKKTVGSTPNTVNKDVKKFDNDNKQFHPGHWEKQRVAQREFKNNQWAVVYVYETVYVGPSWY
jgi:hypothetical protein